MGDPATLTERSRLECEVKSAYGFFDSYSPPPEVGAKLQIDLAEVSKQRGDFRFTPGDSYVPYPVPFKLSHQQVEDEGRNVALLYSAAFTKRDSVRLELSSSKYGKPNQARAVILSVSNVVTGACFLECVILATAK